MIHKDFNVGADDLNAEVVNPPVFNRRERFALADRNAATVRRGRFLFDRDELVFPTADVDPVIARLIRRGAEHQEETFGTVDFSGGYANIVIGPRGVALQFGAEEKAAVVRAGVLLDNAVGPAPALVGSGLEGAVPNEFAPKPAVAGVVNMFEEVRVNFFVDFIDDVLRNDRRVDRVGGEEGRRPQRNGGEGERGARRFERVERSSENERTERRSRHKNLPRPTSGKLGGTLR